MSLEKVFKTVIVGGAGTGKTCLRNRFLHNSYSWQYQATRNADFVSTYVLLDSDDMVAMQIWDTGGDDSEQATANSLCEDADGIFLLFTPEANSIAALDRHFKKLRQVMDKRAKSGSGMLVVVLVLAKTDTKGQMAADEEVCGRVQEECRAALGGREVAFVETSARTGNNVALAFRTMANLCQDEWSRAEAMVNEKTGFSVLRRNKVRVSRHGDPITPYHRLDMDGGSELSVKRGHTTAPLATFRLRLKRLGRQMLCCM
ncbi:hypothetical protein GGI15_004034 [Coemansia interrupta]|uniref:Uncharacterized protein n=1 Tax=Coemansia interrupta TaxID=1126814 RepID=A0A9W8LHA5_9FUNG|nr:hypothetical protein GGI15_004034 [Coemansia interrupta]